MAYDAEAMKRETTIVNRGEETVWRERGREGGVTEPGSTTATLPTCR